MPVGRRRHAIVAAAALVGGCGEPLTPPTPPLLKGVSARGGWWNNGCPPRDEIEASIFAGPGEALSPELTERLGRQFPLGSSAERMAHSLRDQGFRIESPCENAQSVRVAYFRQKGGAFYGPYPMEADIAWEQDERGRLLWTKGHVFFVGP